MAKRNVRRLFLSLSLLLAAAALVAAADILSQLGVNQAIARESAISAVGSMSFEYTLVSPALKKVSGAARAQLVEGLIGWLKAYTATDDFKGAYATMRAHQQPKAPQFKGTPEEEFAANLEKQNADIAKGLASLPPEQRKEMEATMKQAAAAMATPQMKQMQVDGIRRDREQKTAAYNERLKRWTNDYPEDSRVLIARRLQEFLDTSATVDFGAAIEKRGTVMRFTNPAYEEKSSEWKLCYRAGKETVAAARAAAQAWLQEVAPPSR